MAVHNPITFATSLSSKLASGSRHACVFLGAGVARACGLPDIGELQAKVLARLGTADRAIFEHELERGNLEQALSRLQRVAALLTGNQTIDGLSAKQASDLDTTVCRAVIRELDITSAKLAPVLRFAAWAARAN